MEKLSYRELFHNVSSLVTLNKTVTVEMRRHVAERIRQDAESMLDTLAEYKTEIEVKVGQHHSGEPCYVTRFSRNGDFVDIWILENHLDLRFNITPILKEIVDTTTGVTWPSHMGKEHLMFNALNQGWLDSGIELQLNTVNSFRAMVSFNEGQVPNILGQMVVVK